MKISGNTQVKEGDSNKKMVQFLISIYNLIIVSLALNITSDELKKYKRSNDNIENHIY